MKLTLYFYLKGLILKSRKSRSKSKSYFIMLKKYNNLLYGIRELYQTNIFILFQFF